MSWIIIVLVVAVVLGPIMYALPSAKDKRISAIRAAARQAGLEVKLAQIPKLDPASHERVSASGIAKLARRAATAYRLPHDIDSLRSIGQLLLRVPPSPTISFYEVFPGWAVQDQGHTQWWQANQAFWLEWLSQLPLEVQAVEVDGRFFACYWRESGGVDSGLVELIAVALKDCRNHFSS